MHTHRVLERINLTVRRVVMLIILTVALLWAGGPVIRAAADNRAGESATPANSADKAVSGDAATAATPATTGDKAVTGAAAKDPEPAPAAGAPAGQAKKQSATACNVNGKIVDPCPPSQLKQAKRQAARQNARSQKTGVAVKFAGVSSATAAISPLAPAAALGPGARVAALAPLATPDYFGVGNYANSPFPTITAGVISGGMKKFIDTLPGLCGVSTNNLGQCIPLATKDTSVSFAFDPAGGSDFYRIGLNEYTKQMHSSLAPTPIRGYFDAVADPSGTTSHQYLGPLILATRNRPVRILFTNQIATDLNIPVDTTYMGAGTVSDGTNSQTSSQKRATLHLHGGNTPWISDGTTHQWITPSGGDGQPVAKGFAKGFSFMNVPDMAGAGTVNPTPSLTDGMGTFYWTNQQSGRLMFYHDHAYGITRLNVYAGEAAGYLLVDPAEETALAAASAPGTIVTDPTTGGIVTADLPHVVPLVIQDKTFVPDVIQLAAQDPTWDTATLGGAGAFWYPHVYMPNQNPADITGANGFGRWDYGPWFFPPQNPSTFVAGGQPYACTSSGTPAGGWAFPPLMCPGTPNPSGTPEGFMDTPVVNGTAYPTFTVDPAAYRFQVLNAANDRGLNLGLYVADPLAISIADGGSGYAPGAPPAVSIPACPGITGATANVDQNGVVTGITVTYPSTGPACVPPVTVGIDPPPVAGTQAYAIASVNTEVKMVPAIPANAGRALPNCANANALPMAGGGQVTAPLSGGNLMFPPTGMPAGCWPMYSSAQGYSAGPLGENGALSWGNSDSRTGGVPDPTTAGPPIIQIGAEGGVLPQVAVIPSTAISYDYNKRSITVLNVLNHGLWLGPAERADIIVDFSAFAGKTLILYNDAPAPIPAGDPRLDYYTNDPDNSSTGGAPTTMAGYGPNMRTIMQVVVNSTGTGNTTPFNLSSLVQAVPGIFAATQEPVILAEPAYPVGHGNGPATYIPIQATSIFAWVGGPVGSLTMTSGGAGYTAIPNVNITGGGGTGAAATATLGPAAVASVTLTNTGGFGYLTPPGVSFSGGGGTGAAATAVLGNQGVRSITLTNGGSGYVGPVTVTISSPPSGTQATATATVQTSGQRRITAVTVTNPGSGYLTAPTITFRGSNNTGTGATATANLGSRVTGFTALVGGSNYSSAPAVAVAAPPSANCVPASLCTTATASAALAPRSVASFTLTNGGVGYSSAPTVTVDPPQTTGSTAAAVANPPEVPLLPKTIQELFTLDYGRMNATLGVELPFTNFLTQTTIPYGYADPPTEIFKDGETQLWKITHNGVDTHFIHFHLFTVQVINRVGWDGAIKPPDPYELGMKDTVRMNPLEDIIVALRPFKQTLPFPVPSSNRPMNVTRPVGFQSTIEFTNLDPANNPATVTNDVINFGWEFVWHCHILGHEENDMMRAMILAVAPAAPTVTAVTGPSKGNITLTISSLAGQPNFADPTGYTIRRSTSAAGPWTIAGTAPATIVGTAASATFTDTGLTSKVTYFYQVVSSNRVGYTQVYAAPAIGYPNVSADSAPATASAVAK